MSDFFHSGERAIQTQAGTQHQADRLRHGFHRQLPEPAQRFLSQQRLAVASSVDSNGHVWASLLSGAPGFIQARDSQNVAIAYQPPADDPLHEQLRDGAPLGLLVIDLAERRRVRINGVVALQPDGTLGMHVEMAYANCPKYIQARVPLVPATSIGAAQPVVHGQTLNSTQQSWVATADTFFIASYHPTDGADASHRGGQPGFVEVRDATTLIWPDYAGNGLFNTLGNIAEYPRVGLLFVDFDSGRTLQIAGIAQVDWDITRAAALPGAERVVEYQITDVIEQAGVLQAGWDLLSYSPFNPS
jgi:predicted pyridoxine 5'-phosphate oxidase superfamily flavin-nucleotide-binding protein